MLQYFILQSFHPRSNNSNHQHHKMTVYIYSAQTPAPALTELFFFGHLTRAFIFLWQVNLTEMLWRWSMNMVHYQQFTYSIIIVMTTVSKHFCFSPFCSSHLFRRLLTHPGTRNNACLHKRTSNQTSTNQYDLQASYSGVTVPSFHSIRISPRCKAGEECGRRMACSVSGALSLGTGDPGTLASDLGVYDFRTHTTFFLLAGKDINRHVGGRMFRFLLELRGIFMSTYLPSIFSECIIVLLI